MRLHMLFLVSTYFILYFTFIGQVSLPYNGQLFVHDYELGFHWKLSIKYTAIKHKYTKYYKSAFKNPQSQIVQTIYCTDDDVMRPSAGVHWHPTVTVCTQHPWEIRWNLSRSDAFPHFHRHCAIPNHQYATCPRRETMLSEDLEKVYQVCQQAVVQALNVPAAIQLLSAYYSHHSVICNYLQIILPCYYFGSKFYITHPQWCCQDLVHRGGGQKTTYN